jgi:tetratricopeptide (TPR) repeat protein
MKAAERLSALLIPWIEAAIGSHDDWTVVSLFHRHGVMAEQRYARSPVLLEIAESHRRLGFTNEAVRLFQQVLKVQKDSALVEPALMGLGKLYLDQQDPEAARRVLERYRFQFPLGKYESEALHLLIDTMREQRDLQGLLHLCRTWLMRHPVHRERPAMYLQLAKTLGELEKLGESALAYEEAIKAGATQSAATLLSYADTLSRLNRHESAIAAYQSVLEKKPKAHQAEWAHLQMAKHWTALKQYDRATVALAELDVADDQMVNRIAASLKMSLQTARQSQKVKAL